MAKQQMQREKFIENINPFKSSLRHLKPKIFLGENLLSKISPQRYDFEQSPKTCEYI